MKYLVDANTTVIAIDPGDKYMGIVAYNERLFYTNQLTTTGDYVAILETIQEAIKTKQVIIVIEDFLKYGHKAHIKHYTQNTTSQMIGVIELWAQLNNYQLVKQRASQAKIWTDNRLIKLGLLYATNQNRYIFNKYELPRHTRDAYRHLIYFLNKHKFNGCISNKKFDV